jgi:hypothetical protein
MSDLDTSDATLDEPAKQRSVGSRFAVLGDRLARTFGTAEPSDADLASWEPKDDSDEPAVAEPPQAWEPVARRFPSARHGYDRAAVDEHVAELERELAELRRHSSASAVAAEIERIGTQTAAILHTAHEQAQETTRRGQAQADRCLAAAASNAVAITEEATQQLQQLDSDTDAVWRERARLIEDVRIVATSLFSLAEEAADRFPAEPEKIAPPVRAAVPPARDEMSNGRHFEDPEESWPGADGADAS